jgi:hypothetical protein
MPVEPFDVTDDNGVRVQGTAEAARDPNGAYYDPKSPYYGNPRYAERHFEFLNPREACIIDPQVLSSGMQDAFSEALKRLGIEKPSDDNIKNDVEKSIRKYREQCAQNSDKYVSNRTSSAADWGGGQQVGDNVRVLSRRVVARQSDVGQPGIPASPNDGGPSVSSDFTGGQLGRIAALLSVDPDQPNQFVPPNAG